jgi:hypothetical protein
MPLGRSGFVAVLPSASAVFAVLPLLAAAVVVVIWWVLLFLIAR